MERQLSSKINTKYNFNFSKDFPAMSLKSIAFEVSRKSMTGVFVWYSSNVLVLEKQSQISLHN